MCDYPNELARREEEAQLKGKLTTPIPISLSVPSVMAKMFLKDAEPSVRPL